MAKKRGKTISIRDIQKIYEWLVASQVVSILDIKNKTQFANLFKSSDTELKKLLTFTYNNEISNLHGVIEHPQQDAVFQTSKRSFGLGVSMDNRGKTKLQLKTGKASSPVSGVGKAHPSSAFKWHTEGERKKAKVAIQRGTLVGSNVMGIMDILMPLFHALQKVREYMIDKKRMIDSHGTDSGDKLFLGYATYSSNKGDRKGFKGYVITGHKVQNTVQNKALEVISLYERLIAGFKPPVDPEDPIAHGQDGSDPRMYVPPIIDEMAEVYVEFVAHLDSFVRIEHPIGERYEINLGEVRKISEKNISEGAAGGSEGAYGVDVHDIFAPLANVGLGYIDRFTSLFNVVTKFKQVIGAGATTRIDLPKGGESRLQWRT